MATGWNFEICAHLEMKTVYLAEAAVEESSALSCIAKSSSTSSLSQSSAQYCFSSVSSDLSIHPSCISTGLSQYTRHPKQHPFEDLLRPSPAHLSHTCPTCRGVHSACTMAKGEQALIRKPPAAPCHVPLPLPHLPFPKNDSRGVGLAVLTSSNSSNSSSSSTISYTLATSLSFAPAAALSAIPEFLFLLPANLSQSQRARPIYQSNGRCWALRGWEPTIPGSDYFRQCAGGGGMGHISQPLTALQPEPSAAYHVPSARPSSRR